MNNRKLGRRTDFGCPFAQIYRWGKTTEWWKKWEGAGNILHIDFSCPPSSFSLFRSLSLVASATVARAGMGIRHGHRDGCVHLFHGPQQLFGQFWEGALRTAGGGNGQCSEQHVGLADGLLHIALELDLVPAKLIGGLLWSRDVASRGGLFVIAFLAIRKTAAGCPSIRGAGAAGTALEDVGDQPIRGDVIARMAAVTPTLLLDGRVPLSAISMP